mmetsp:Transcript_1269/g.3773  ORF Transcript_1269/g.3773 Transcript_1269/m.3773 type:complete len:299 (-) Transcript_1269:2263-3159(-)
MNRCGLTHVCPAFRNFAIIAPETALSISASSKTIKGAFPPSSRDSFFNPARLANHFPTLVDPVKLIFFTTSDSVIASPTRSLSFVTIISKASLGTPASYANSTNFNAHNGVNSLGFKSTEHPLANAAATFLVTIAAGKFHGVITPTTPTGCLMTEHRLDVDVDDPMFLPYALDASSENHCTNEFAYATSPSDSFRGLPFSYVMSFAIVSFSRSIFSCHRRNTDARYLPVRRCHVVEIACVFCNALFIRSSVSRHRSFAFFFVDETVPNDDVVVFTVANAVLVAAFRTTTSSTVSAGEI